MLVVISDLHFEEEDSDTIRVGDRSIGLARNVPARAFEKVFRGLAQAAKQTGARELELVLAGDVFDLHRTAMWFDAAPCVAPHPWPNPRPYVNNGSLCSQCEATVLRILEKIAENGEVGRTLALIRLLKQGRYRDSAEREASTAAFPVDDVKVHFLPGNHDRLLNATPRLRGRVGELLGLDGGTEAFLHTVSSADPRAFVRHGHEYDRYNFGEDYEGFDPFPESIPDAHYDAPTLGDFITLEVATALPVVFRKVYGDGSILADPVLSQVYVRLLEFDDVRPQSAVLDFLLGIPGGPGEEAIWGLLKPVVRELLGRIYDHEFLKEWLDRLGHETVSLLLRSKIWKSDLGLDLARRFSGLIHAAKSPGCVAIAGREAALREARFVIAGHTHQPQVNVIGADERYYVDTGTWRHCVFWGEKRTGRVKALTYVVAYRSDEDRGAPPVSKSESFDFWSGNTQRWDAGAVRP